MFTSSLYLPEEEDLAAIVGPISTEEGAHLAYLAIQVPDKGVIVEIGSLRGKSACYMGSALRYKNIDAKIYCIDLWMLGGPTQQKNHNDPKQFAAYMVNREKFRLEGYLIPNMAESVEFSKHWIFPIDLLFIDAGHTFEACSADYAAWQKFLKVGGHIAFHDYFEKWPGVCKTIDTIVKPSGNYGEYHQEYRLWTAKRIR